MKQLSHILNTLPSLARAERAALARPFVAPVVRGGRVTVPIRGVRCAFAVEPDGFDGWGLFRPVADDRAILARMATPGERMNYLIRLPTALLILCVWRYPHWDAVLANVFDRRFPARATVPVCLVGPAKRFDTVRARFDGERFLFESFHAAANPDLAGLLRKTLD